MWSIYGIYLFEFERKPTVTHLSAFGDIWHTSLKDCIRISKEHSYAAGVVYKIVSFNPAFAAAKSDEKRT